MASTRYLCAQLDEAYTWAPENASTREGRALLAFNALLPPTSAVRPEELDGAPQNLQKQLSAAVDEHQHSSFLANLGIADRADVQSELLPGASAFLEAMPNEKLGLLSTFRAGGVRDGGEAQAFDAGP